MRWPALDADSAVGWSLRLHREFHMKDDSDLFRTELGPKSLPLYEGKMLHQFRNWIAEPKYWIDETEAERDC